LFLVASITAVSIANKNVEVSKEYLIVLKEKNLTEIPYTDSEQDGLYQRCLKKEICEEVFVNIDIATTNGTSNINYSYQDCRSIINTCSGWIDKKQLDDWEKQRMEGIANATIERNNRAEVTKDTKGTTTITEKK